jgi:hypothetical protein
MMIEEKLPEDDLPAREGKTARRERQASHIVTQCSQTRILLTQLEL